MKIVNRRIVVVSLVTFLAIFHGRAMAQNDSIDSLLLLSDEVGAKVTGAFKSTRVIQTHSIEMLHKGTLDVRILHRFGLINAGVSELFGLDQATMRIGLDYGISDNLTVGFGRSTFKKEIDGFFKWRILTQSTGKRQMPVTMVVVVGSTIFTEKVYAGYQPTVGERTGFYLQLLLGRKVNEKFSFQLTPMVVHRNYVPSQLLDNTLAAIGGGARYKLSKRLALTADYQFVEGNLPTDHKNPLGIGLDIETGGHVFQLHFSNAIGMNERAYIVDTNNDFFKGDIRFGFNLSRLFSGRKSLK